MKKVLSVVASAAILCGVLLASPQKAEAARRYSAWVSNTGTPAPSAGQNCNRPDYLDLNDALAAASDGWVIYLCPGMYTPLMNGDSTFYVQDDVTILGAGPGRTVLDGVCQIGYGPSGMGATGATGGTGAVVEQPTSVFYSDSDVVLTLKNLSVINGCAFQDDYYGWSHGGGVAMYDGGDFVCNNVVFSNNKAATSGGAVFADDVTLNKCTFDNNFAASSGGAIYAYSSITDRTSTFRGNGACTGGAVTTEYGGLLSNSIFTGNTTFNVWSYLGISEYSCGGFGSYGGAGGAVASLGGQLQVRGGRYAGNSAIGGGAIAAGIGTGYSFITGIGSEWSLYTQKATFTANQGCVGGAVFADSMVDVGSLFASNSWRFPCGVPGGSAIFGEYAISLSRTQFRGNAVGIPGLLGSSILLDNDCDYLTMIKVKFDGRSIPEGGYDFTCGGGGI